jgi:multicomponent Na+:H+ antiporter subunit A
MVVASAAVCRVKDPFVMLLVSGLCGVGTAVLCLFAGAPDVAFTQFAVEVAFVVVVAAVVLRVRTLSLPRSATPPAAPRLALGLVLGVLVAVALLTSASGPSDDSLVRYFGERSLPDAHGRNVANVIIVDFRALDTLGEIAVVAVTFLAVLPLFRLLSRARAPREKESA